MRLDNYLKRVGDNIRRARIKAGLRQVDIKTKSGLTYRHYQSIEARKINLSIITLHRLAQLRGTPISQLVLGCAK